MNFLEYFLRNGIAAIKDYERFKNLHFKSSPTPSQTFAPGYNFLSPYTSQ